MTDQPFDNKRFLADYKGLRKHFSEGQTKMLMTVHYGLTHTDTVEHIKKVKAHEELNKGKK